MIGPLKKLRFYKLYLFTAAILLFTIILDVIAPHIVYDKVWWLIVFFFLLTLISFSAVVIISGKNPKSFIAVYFTAMIARLFISILVASAFILLDKQHVMQFAYNFIVLYLLFLGFEIYGIMTNLRHQNKKGINNE